MPFDENFVYGRKEFKRFLNSTIEQLENEQKQFSDLETIKLYNTLINFTRFLGVKYDDFENNIITTSRFIFPEPLDNQ